MTLGALPRRSAGDLSDPPSGADAPPPPRRRRRRLFRFTALLLLACLLLLLVVLLVPWSFDWVDRRVQSAWRKATGTGLTYSEATLRLLSGTFTVQSPRILDPATDRPLASFEQLTVNLPFAELVSLDSPIIIESISVSGPFAAAVALVDSRPRLLGDAALLLDRYQEHRRRLAAEEPEDQDARDRIGIRKIQFEPLSLRLLDVPTTAALADGTVTTAPLTLDAITTHAVLLELDDARLELDFAGTLRPTGISLEAGFNGHPREEGLALTLNRVPGGEDLDFDLAIARFLSRADLPWPAEPWFEVRGLAATGRIRRAADGPLHSRADLQLAELRVQEAPASQIGDAATTSGRSLGPLSLALQAELSPDFKQLQFDSIELHNGSLALEAAGRLTLARPFRYVVDVARLMLSDTALDLATVWLPGAGRMPQPPDARIRFAAHAAGDLLGLRPDALQGQLEISGFDWQQPSLPAPLQRLDLQASLTTESLRIVQASAQMGGIPLRIGGELRGRPLLGEIDLLRLTWEASGALEDVTGLADRWMTEPARELTLTGHIEGRGEAVLESPFEGAIRDALERARITGQIELDNVTARHPWLPWPVSDLNLRVNLAPERAEVTALTATAGETVIEATGTLSGEPRFWSRPRIEGAGKVNGRLQDLAALAAKWVEPMPALAGGVRANFEGATTVGDWDDARVDGEVILSDVDFALVDPQFECTGLDARLNVTTDRVEIEPLSAACLDRSVQAEGRILGEPVFWRAPRLEFSAATAGPVDEIVAFVRNEAARFDAELPELPPAEGNAEIRIAGEGSLARPATFELRAFLDLADYRTELNYPHIQGPLRLSGARVELARDRLTISDTTGALGELPLSLAAEITPAGGEIQAGLSGALPSMKRHLPTLFEYMAVDGATSLSETIRWRLREGAAPPADLEDVWRAMRPENPSADPDAWLASIRERYDLTADGSAQLQSAEITPSVFPTRLTNISGTVRHDLERAWTPEPVAVDAGEGTTGARAVVEILFPLGGVTPELRFDIVSAEHINVTAWTHEWNRLHPDEPHHAWPEDLQYDANLARRFIIRGQGRSRTAEYRQFQGEDFRFRLGYDLHEGQPSMLTWSDVEAVLAGGVFRHHGSLFNHNLGLWLAIERGELQEIVRMATQKDKQYGLASGIITGEVELGRRVGDVPTPWRGQGQLRIEESRFVSNKIFNSLGGLLKLPFFEDISFSTIEGPFTVHGEWFSSDGITFNGPIVNLKASGDVGPDEQLDLKVQIEFLQIAGRIPLVAQALEIFNRLAGQVLMVRIRGTFDNPDIQPLGL